MKGVIEIEKLFLNHYQSIILAFVYYLLVFLFILFIHSVY